MKIEYTERVSLPAVSFQSFIIITILQWLLIAEAEQLSVDSHKIEFKIGEHVDIGGVKYLINIWASIFFPDCFYNIRIQSYSIWMGVSVRIAEIPAS